MGHVPERSRCDGVFAALHCRVRPGDAATGKHGVGEILRDRVARHVGKIIMAQPSLLSSLCASNEVASAIEAGPRVESFVNANGSDDKFGREQLFGQAGLAQTCGKFVHVLGVCEPAEYCDHRLIRKPGSNSSSRRAINFNSSMRPALASDAAKSAYSALKRGLACTA